MARDYKKRAIVIINEETGERLDFESVNAASLHIGTNFSNLQRAAMYNGLVKGWRVYESPDTIRKHIADLEEQLRIVEGK